MTSAQRISNIDDITGYRLDCRLLCDFLIVDDDQEIRIYLKNIINYRRGNNNVVDFSSVLDTLNYIDCINVKNIKCAIIDLNLNDGNGLTIVDKLLSKDKNCPIIIYSGDYSSIASAYEVYDNISIVHKTDLGRLYNILGIGDKYECYC